MLAKTLVAAADWSLIREMAHALVSTSPTVASPSSTISIR
jgi:hypothetical protein